MQKTYVAFAAALLLAGFAAPAAAQDYGFEIIPTFGFRWGGGLSSLPPPIREFDTEDDIAYGIGIGKRMNPMSGVEIAWTHFQGDVDVRFDAGTATGGPLKRDDILLNGIWYADRGTNTLPFLTAGLGASIFAIEDVDSETRFAWMLGGGVRQDVSDKTAIRVGVKWMPMWIATGTGIWCDPFFCYTATTGESYDQFEVQGALIFKLGQ